MAKVWHFGVKGLGILYKCVNPKCVNMWRDAGLLFLLLTLVRFLKAVSGWAYHSLPNRVPGA